MGRGVREEEEEYKEGEREEYMAGGRCRSIRGSGGRGV